MRQAKLVLFASLLAGLGTVALINEVGISRYPPLATLADGRQAAFNPEDIRSCVGARMLAAIGDQSSQWQWQHCEQGLMRAQALAGFELRYWSLLIACAFTAVAVLGFAFVLRSASPPSRVLRGRRLLIGDAARRAFVAAAKAESARSGIGLELLPELPISAERETRHMLIWGSVGAGKTQTMLHVILAAIARGDGVLVLDVKGEMTAGLPGNPLLIAPQDRRSLVWDVAIDCRTKQDARELAARLIPPSDDPLWSDAARDILVACVASLQATKSGSWTWRDLHTVATADERTLLEFAKAYHRDAVRLLEQPDSRTTQSVLSTFQAHIHVIAALADAWDYNARAGYRAAQSNLRPRTCRLLGRYDRDADHHPHQRWALCRGGQSAHRRSGGGDDRAQRDQCRRPPQHNVCKAA
jgi:hypothetical protein